MPIKADLTHLLLVLKSIHQLHESANTPQSSQNGQFKFLLDIKWIGSQAMLKSWKTLKGNKTHVYKRRKALFWSNYQFSSHHYESPFTLHQIFISYLGFWQMFANCGILFVNMRDRDRADWKHQEAAVQEKGRRTFAIKICIWPKISYLGSLWIVH